MGDGQCKLNRLGTAEFSSILAHGSESVGIACRTFSNLIRMQAAEITRNYWLPAALVAEPVTTRHVRIVNTHRLTPVGSGTWWVCID